MDVARFLITQFTSNSIFCRISSPGRHNMPNFQNLSNFQNLPVHGSVLELFYGHEFCPFQNVQCQWWVLMLGLKLEGIRTGL